VLTCSILATAPRPVSAADQSDARVLNVERWLKAVLHHTPGATDAAVLEISSWSNSELGILRIDQGVIVRLMRDPRLSSFQSSSQEMVDCSPCEASQTPQPRKIQPPQRIRYTDTQLHRLQVLACAAAGILREPPCERLRAPEEIDAELTRLAALASAANERGDHNYVLRRGALLHGDAAMLTAGSLLPLDTGGPGAVQPVRVHIADGQQTNIGLGEIHWEIARLLLDFVRPGRDAMVGSWYRATAAWMQSHEHYNKMHLDHARDMFPNDADIAFLIGCERETYAGPAFQSFARSAVLPTGTFLDIGSESRDLREAEAFFRRALALNPRMVEARVRLGRVLLAVGKAQDAVDELRPAVASTDDPLLQYFGSMFLGAAEEALGHLPGARDAYARAAMLYPRAQSPYLALSALATRRGDRAGALTEIRRVFDLRGAQDQREDPWWAYHVAQGRNTDELLEQLWRPFLEARP
jgi:tetratricopeptide (TPR) repeat protein